MSAQPSLLVFLKYPSAGSVKTRLAASIGSESAANYYRQWIASVLGRLQPMRGSVRIISCFDGAPLDAFAPWQAMADEWWEQPDGDLGHRLESAFATWQTGDGPVAAIGTDCLDFDAALIRSAFETLEANDAVFGPTLDGGYYLVGMAKYIPDFFLGVPWSTEDALAVHLENCRRREISVGLLPMRRDIDTWEDLLDYERQEQLCK